MTYKSIIAVASGHESDAHLLKAAARLAAQHAAEVRVVPAFSDPAADLVYFGAALKNVPEAVIERVRAGERDQQRQLETRVAEAAAREGLSERAEQGAAAMFADKRELMPAVAIAAAAVLADLVMFGGDPAREALSAPFAETLLNGRAPILIVRDDQFGPGRIAIAWDGSAQAGRAVRAAIPLLRMADEVVILQNIGDLKHATRIASPEALGAYLAQHGVQRVRTQRVEGDNIAASLLRGTIDAHCSTLIAGAYGRPRLYELALGGTTRALVNSDDRVHLLLAH